MSDIRFNNWYHQSGTGGVTQTGIGSVGIGITTPSVPLEIADDSITITKITSLGDDSAIRTTRLDFNFSDGGGAAIAAKRAAGVANTETYLSIRTGGSTNDDEKLRIESNGNVGINTNNATEKLHVIGEGNFSSSTSATPTLTLTNSGGLGSGTGTGAIITKFVGDSDSIVIRNIQDGDYGIYNDQQNNGIEFYDGTGGVVITYNGSARVTANNSGVTIDGVLSGDGSGLTNLLSTATELSTSQNANGAGTVTFSDVPAGVNRITVMFRDLSLSGGNDIQIQLGTSSSWITSGYSSLSSGESGSTDISATTGFIIRCSDAGNNAFGQMIISRFGSGSWVESGQFKMTNSTSSQCYGDLGGYGSGTITRLRIQTSGSNTFDGGNINVLYG